MTGRRSELGTVAQRQADPSAWRPAWLEACGCSPGSLPALPPLDCPHPVVPPATTPGSALADGPPRLRRSSSRCSQTRAPTVVLAPMRKNGRYSTPLSAHERCDFAVQMALSEGPSVAHRQSLVAGLTVTMLPYSYIQFELQVTGGRSVSSALLYLVTRIVSDLAGGSDGEVSPTVCIPVCSAR